MKKITIIGAGSWGTALAKAAAEAGNDVLLFARDIEVVNDINNNGINSKYNINVQLGIKATDNFNSALNHSDVIMLATPLKTQRQVLNQIKEAGKNPRILINVSKGFEPGTGKLPSQIIAEIFPNANAVTLTGPSHAESLIINGVTAVMSLCKDQNIADEVANMFRTKYFRIYTGSDILGGEIYGAAKNVYAIGAGILDALKETDNTKAAYITRALHELNKLGTKLGADVETIFSLAGVGDLIVTAFSFNSRNYSFGYSLITGTHKPTTTVEGVNTVKTILEVAKANGIEMPIATVIDKIIDGKIDPKDGIDLLMDRKQY